MQNGKKIEIPAPTYSGISSSSAITPEFCTNQFKVFDDRDRFSEVGGFPQLNKALDVPMVLVMSIWDDVSLTSSINHFGEGRELMICSITPTCSGLTQLTRQRRLALQVLLGETARNPRVFHLKSRLTVLMREFQANCRTNFTQLTRSSQVIWSNIRFGPVGSTVQV